MATLYFNWDEIFSLSRKDLAAIICLTYAQSTYYNELSSKTMMYKLKLNHVPQFLFSPKCFIHHKNSLVCYYRTKEPQSYIKNPSFLFMNAPARAKAVYIKALGMRRISESQDYIPLKYFPNIQPNPLINIQDNKIFFPLESSVLRNYTTKN